MSPYSSIIIMSAPSKRQRGPNGTAHEFSTVAKSAADPRFAGIKDDPRYRLPGKRRTQVKVDKRFAHMLDDDDFTRKAKVDRYGRPLETDAERNRLKRKYKFDDDADDKPDDDDVVQAELERVEKKAFDPIRDVRDGDDSSSESSSDEEDEAEDETEDLDQAALGKGVQLGEATPRLAVVNLDWDHIRAEDLMAVFSSFLPAGGRLLKVVVYPSEFGRERMEREEMEGPPRELFASRGSRAEDTYDDEDDEEIKKSIIKPDTGEEFDSAELRKYQLERLRYYYAVLTFSSTEIAKAIYDAVDGTEYLSTANFFDLRFIPEDTDFSSDKFRDECDQMPDNYKPNEFVTDALQHSKVKLTWDADDAVRKDAQAKAFKGGRKEIDENDLKAYLGSDSSDSEEEVEAAKGSASTGPKLSKKEEEKQRLRALLGLGSAPAKRTKTDGPVGDVQITFSSGLGGDDKKKPSVFANDPEPEETTMERYVRKERERKQRRKEKSKAPQDEPEEPIEETKAAIPEPEELGFNDPFFTEPLNDKTAANNLRKEAKKKKREEREKEEAATAAKRAELELLMVDDKQANVRHFNMNDIEKAEKQKKKAGKKGSKKGKKDVEEAVETAEDDFKMNVADPRFASLYESHEFAIDPTNPKYKGTSGMKALLEEGRKRRKYDEGNENATAERKKDRKEKQKKKAASDPSTKGSEGQGEDLSKLIQKVKAKGKA